MAAVLGLLFLGFSINNNSVSFGDELFFKDYLLLFICGFIGVFAMIIPGVSGILIFLILGYYGIFLDAINNVYHIHTMLDAIKVGLPVGIGMLCGIIPASLLMKTLLKKFPVGTYFCIFGFVIGSIACLFISYFHEYASPDALNWVLGIIALIAVGFASYFITYIANKKSNKEENTEKIEDENKEVSE